VQKIMFVSVLLLLISIPAAGQSLPRADVFGGYTYTNTHSSNGDSSNYNGASVGAAYYPSTWFGVAADVGRSTASGFKDSTGAHNVASSSATHYLFGPRFRLGNSRFTPFIETLVGGVNRSNLMASNGSILVGAQKSFGILAGGGLDIKLTSHIAIRPIDVGLLSTWFSPGAGIHNSQDDVSLSSGIVLRWN
jgi:hypothetical protein